VPIPALRTSRSAPRSATPPRAPGQSWARAVAALAPVLRLALGAALALPGGAALPAQAAEARVAVAANFTAATHRLAAAFERESGHRLIASFASTGTLYAQIRNGAPYDVFLSADMERPRLLESEGLGVAGTRFTYAVGRLALWSAQPGLALDDGAVLRGDAVRRLAIANPKTAPYGSAARQVLEHMGLWEALQGRLVQAENIAQTYQYVVTGNATVGFVALAQLEAAQPASAWWLPPAGWYAPIEQQALLLRRGADNAAARAFLAYLRGPAARATLAALGYGAP
jgi:molybdate transport system substrate-binding protein